MGEKPIFSTGLAARRRLYCPVQLPLLALAVQEVALKGRQRAALQHTTAAAPLAARNGGGEAIYKAPMPFRPRTMPAVCKGRQKEDSGGGGGGGNTVSRCVAPRHQPASPDLVVYSQMCKGAAARAPQLAGRKQEP